MNQCWPKSMSPYSVTRPEWVNFADSISILIHSCIIKLVWQNTNWVTKASKPIQSTKMLKHASLPSNQITLTHRSRINKKISTVNHFIPTVLTFCHMLEEGIFPHDTEFWNCRGKIVASRVIFSLFHFKFDPWIIYADWENEWLLSIYLLVSE